MLSDINTVKVNGTSSPAGKDCKLSLMPLMLIVSVPITGNATPTLIVIDEVSKSNIPPGTPSTVAVTV